MCQCCRRATAAAVHHPPIWWPAPPGNRPPPGGGTPPPPGAAGPRLPMLMYKDGEPLRELRSYYSKDGNSQCVEVS